MLQRILERVTGRPIDALLRERLFAPLGMTDTRFDNLDDSGPGRHTDVVPRRAAVYQWGGGRQANFVFPFSPRSYSAGGLFASASDLATWIAALDTGRLLRPEYRERLWTPARLADGSAAPFGVGWAVGTYRGRRVASHSGGPALADILRFVDDRLTIIVLANQQAMYPYLAQGVADRLVPAPKIVDAPIPDRAPGTTAALTGLLRGLAGGQVDPAPFAPEARGPMVGAIEQFALPLFRALGPPRSLVLLEDTATPGGPRVRRYRAWYGAKPVRWRFDLDAQGQILSLEPTPE